ncbi:methionine--tRNA ligase [Candidatus Marinamargulisbacteria bacterium SCGC AAA071-K20]|nr:methionine--tRNA ligase [Candidatus Marinamargulisbacteria bacterium SCGC AAA071-K20]
MTKRKLLVTSALPYANGSIHIGHLVEYIQTDIWARFQKLIGNDCVYICADDTHGTPIMLNAQKQGKTPEEFIKMFHEEHQDDFKRFHVKFDYFGSTNSDENRILSENIYKSAKAAGAIYEKEIEQLYDDKKGMFLPDRFVQGTCPKCDAKEQYGDSCEVCSATYSPMDLKEPKSVVSGEVPVKKKSSHHFFKLSQFEDTVKDWLSKNVVRPEVRNKLNEWFETGLRDWDISRDEPYFGFKIPGTTDKYFYVWLDAPVGYIACTQNWAKDKSVTHDDIWKGDDWEIHHFIGKDILYFHTLFWPAMLSVGGYKQPEKVNIHGFLTVNGEKMSKSRGTFILAKDFGEKVNPEFLRYFYAAKLNGGLDDLDLNLDDFLVKINSDVLGKFINIGSRLGSILHKKLDGQLSSLSEDGEALLTEIRAKADDIKTAYETLDFNKAMRLIMGCADLANKYIDAKAPWAMVKVDPDAAKQVCTDGLNAFRLLAIYLQPVLPEISEKIKEYLCSPDFTWESINDTLSYQSVNPYEHLAGRLQKEDLDTIVQS